MGPRHYSRGNLINSIEDVFFNKVVSMGPRHYSRGNDNRCIYGSIPKNSFNGATTLQSWKLDDVDKDMMDIEKVSMGPRHYSRGNLNVYSDDNILTIVSMGPRHYSRGNSVTTYMLFSDVRCFNGATTLQSWKPSIG